MLNGGKILSRDESARLLMLTGSERQALIEKIVRELQQRERVRQAAQAKAVAA